MALGLIVDGNHSLLQRERGEEVCLPEGAVADDGGHGALCLQVLRGQPAVVECDGRVIGARVQLEEGQVVAAIIGVVAGHSEYVDDAPCPTQASVSL